MAHFIAGGSDTEQAREGDFLTKEERYGRLEEYIRILRRAWQSADPFDWDCKYYSSNPREWDLCRRFWRYLPPKMAAIAPRDPLPFVLCQRAFTGQGDPGRWTQATN